MGRCEEELKRATSKKSRIAARLRVAEAQKDWVAVCDVLYEACDYEPEVLELAVPQFIGHHYWNLRATAVEVAGIRRLHQCTGLVAARLRDPNAVVRSYALMAYYELVGAKAGAIINDYCEGRDVGVRLTALALRYIQTGETDVLSRIARILGRKTCKPQHRSTILNIFDYYYKGRPDTAVLEVFAAILPGVPEDFGQAKEIKDALAKWKRNREGAN